MYSRVFTRRAIKQYCSDDTTLSMLDALSLMSVREVDVKTGCVCHVVMLPMLLMHDSVSCDTELMLVRHCCIHREGAEALKGASSVIRVSGSQASQDTAVQWPCSACSLHADNTWQILCKYCHAHLFLSSRFCLTMLLDAPVASSALLTVLLKPA